MSVIIKRPRARSDLVEIASGPAGGGLYETSFLEDHARWTKGSLILVQTTSGNLAPRLDSRSGALRE